MKILHLSKFYKPYSGGIEQVVADICEGCCARDVESSVLAVSHNKDNQKYAINGVQVFSFSSNLHYASADVSIGYITKLKKIINQYDILHVHLPNPLANLAVYLAKAGSKKIVVHWHSDIVKQKKLKFFYQPLQRWLLNRADAIITTSPIYGESSNDLKDYQNKITVIPIGINPENYVVDSQTVESIKAKYPNKKIIFSLGRLVYYKGFDFLIDAAKYLPDDYVILLGGNGEDKPKLLEKIKNQNLQDKVIMVGFINDCDLASYFVACDAFCLPSIEKSEAFGVVQLEAFLFNKPVVSCSIPGSGVGWVNKNKVSGIVVPPKNSLCLAEGLISAIENPGSFSKLKGYFEENFDAKVMVSRTIALYQSLM
ncbi:glycosyltransferase [Enterobacter cancerogenus]|uniref:glycosyltransferase n=1 Tax=Enterobacter cancerogenus TaxID=69218 RepID=UPI0038089E99